MHHTAQVGDINEATIREFAAKAVAAAGGQAGGQAGSSNRLGELRSAVQDASHQPFAASVNGLSSCPHHVSRVGLVFAPAG
jgi:hypothetical protein